MEKHAWKILPLAAIALVITTLFMYCGQTQSLAAEMQKVIQTATTSEDVVVQVMQITEGSTSELNALNTAMVEAGLHDFSENIPENALPEQIYHIIDTFYKVENISSDDFLIQVFDSAHMTESTPETKAEAEERQNEFHYDLRERDPWYTSTPEAQYYSASTVRGEMSTSRDNKFYKIPYTSDPQNDRLPQRSERYRSIKGVRDIKNMAQKMVEEVGADSNFVITKDADGSYCWSRTYANGLKLQAQLKPINGNQYCDLLITYQLGPARYFNNYAIGVLSEGNRVHVPTGEEIVSECDLYLMPLPVKADNSEKEG